MAKVVEYESSDLPARTKAALRLADKLSDQRPVIDRAFYDTLREHLSDDEITDLGMMITFFSGWQRFIEAFGILPDHWRDGAPLPFGPLAQTPRPPHVHGGSASRNADGSASRSAFDARGKSTKND